MRILRQALDSVLFHSQLSAPRECCGILMSQDENMSPIDLVYWGENADTDRPETRFVLDHKSHMKAVEMECAGDAWIVGYYHSHPEGAGGLSCRDIREAVSGTIHMIVGVENGSVECTAWRFQNGRFVQEPLEITD